MNDYQEGETELSREPSEQLQQLQHLLEDVLEPGLEEHHKRKQLITYCRSQGIQESSMWALLTVYRQLGCVLTALQDAEQVSFYAHRQEQFRSRIVELIGKLPPETLKEFRSLLAFRKDFLERTEHISDLLLYFFLEREKGLWRESADSSLYTTYFNNKLFREFNAINEILKEASGIAEAQELYENWLLDQHLDQEAPL